MKGTQGQAASALRPAVALVSCVGGGPLERLALQLEQSVGPVSFWRAFDGSSWRRGMTRSRTSRTLSRLRVFTLFPARVLLRTVVGPERVIVATTNPFVVPPILSATRWLHRKKIIAVHYDLYPEALIAAGRMKPRSVLSRALAGVNRFTAKGLDGEVHIGARLRKIANERYGRPTVSAVLETGADQREFAATVIGTTDAGKRVAAWRGARTMFGYVGNLGRMHDWATLAAAWPRCLTSPEVASRACLVVAASGPGVEPLRSALGSPALETVLFLGPLEDEAWADVMCQVNVSIVSLIPEAADTCLPSKTFSALAAGHALVAIAPRESDLADLVLQTDCGFVIPPGDVAALAGTIERLTHDAALRHRLRGNALKAATTFDTRVLAERWRQVIEQVDGVRRQPVLGTRVNRLLDAVGASVGLALLSPVLLAIAAAIRLSMGRPVLFSQERSGLGGRPFILRKFRTMVNAEGAAADPAYDGARLTRLGRLLRRTSLDELPTLWNVLRGDMSLVGPRPLPVRYLERYTEVQRRRLGVPPGVTGWAQVNGRNALSWDEKLRLDVWYVDNWSVALNLRILWLTLKALLTRRGISHPGSATMPEFIGSNENVAVRPDGGA